MIKLNKLLPNLLQEDEFSRCLSEVLDEYIKEIDNVYNGLFLMHNLDQFDDRVLDEIAKDKSIVWYDSALPIKHKVNIIKNHRSIYRNLGTEGAILQLINDYFGSAGSIDNWYDYGGEHHRFKITLNNIDFDPNFMESYNRFLASLSWVKSADTWLDCVQLNRDISINTSIIPIVNTIKNNEVYIKPTPDKTIETTTYSNGIISSSKTNNIHINVISDTPQRSFFIGVTISNRPCKTVIIGNNNSTIKYKTYRNIVINKRSVRRCRIE